MVNFGGSEDGGDIRNLVEIRGKFQVWRAQRHGFQVFQRFHAVLWILHGDEIIVAALRIYPIARGDHGIGGKSSDEVIDNLLGVETQFGSSPAVYIYLEGGVVHILRDVNIGDAWNGLEFPSQVLRDLIGLFEIHAAHLHVNRRGLALVQHGIDQSARLKIGTHLGKIGRRCGGELGSYSQSC